MTWILRTELPVFFALAGVVAGAILL